jgi:hypothetical protein
MKYMMFVCTDTAPDTDRVGEPDIEVCDKTFGLNRLGP